jgi:hypothetical protein
VDALGDKQLVRHATHLAMHAEMAIVQLAAYR